MFLNPQHNNVPTRYRLTKPLLDVAEGLCMPKACTTSYRSGKMSVLFNGMSVQERLSEMHCMLYTQKSAILAKPTKTIAAVVIRFESFQSAWI